MIPTRLPVQWLLPSPMTQAASLAPRCRGAFLPSPPPHQVSRHRIWPLCHSMLMRPCLHSPPCRKFGSAHGAASLRLSLGACLSGCLPAEWCRISQSPSQSTPPSSPSGSSRALSPCCLHLMPPSPCAPPLPSASAPSPPFGFLSNSCLTGQRST